MIFFILVRQVLQTYNRHSPYVALDRWTGTGSALLRGPTKPPRRVDRRFVTSASIGRYCELVKTILSDGAPCRGAAHGEELQ